MDNEYPGRESDGSCRNLENQVYKNTRVAGFQFRTRGDSEERKLADEMSTRDVIESPVYHRAVK